MESAADGRLWFSLRGSGAIGSIDPRDAEPMRTLRIHRSDTIAAPSALFIDSGQRVWWVNAGTSTIGGLDPADPGPLVAMGPWPEFGAPRAWAMGADGRLWVTTQERPGLLTFDPAAPDAAATVDWFTDSRLRTPDGVWFGIDRAVWFVDTAADAIGRFAPSATGSQAWSFFGEPPEVEGPFDIKPGADPDDGRLWFTNEGGDSIGCIQVARR